MTPALLPTASPAVLSKAASFLLYQFSHDLPDVTSGFCHPAAAPRSPLTHLLLIKLSLLSGTCSMLERWNCLCGAPSQRPATQAEAI